MAIDFPNSPSVGSLFTSQGTTWQYDGTKWIAATSVQPSFANPNKLINPFMEIDQANEGAAVTVNSSYVVDGWLAGITAGTFSAQRVTDAPAGYPNSIQVTLTSSHTVATGDVSVLQVHMEANELADTRFGTASAQTLSLAFWVKSSVAGTYAASFRNTAGNRSYYFPVVIGTANTWQFISEVIPGDTVGTWVTSGTGVGATIEISLYVGSTYQGTTPHTWVAGSFLATTGISNTIATTVGATFQLGPVGLWVAPAAQPLLRTSFQAELARCQRYYEKSYDIGVVPGTAVQGGECYFYTGGPSVQMNIWSVYPRFAVTKRAAPTITCYSPNTGAAGKGRDYTNSADVSAGGANIGMTGFFASGNSSAPAGSVNVALHYVADARF